MFRLQKSLIALIALSITADAFPAYRQSGWRSCGEEKESSIYYWRPCDPEVATPYSHPLEAVIALCMRQPVHFGEDKEEYTFQTLNYRGSTINSTAIYPADKISSKLMISACRREKAIPHSIEIKNRNSSCLSRDKNQSNIIHHAAYVLLSTLGGAKAPYWVDTKFGRYHISLKNCEFDTFPERLTCYSKEHIDKFGVY